MLQRKLSFSNRVMLIISGVTGVTVLIGFLILLFSYIQILKDNLTSANLENAKLIGQYTAVPLLFDDIIGIEKSLSNLVFVIYPEDILFNKSLSV